MEKTFNRLLLSLPLRLVMMALLVIIPVGVSTAWLGTAYSHEIWGVDFGRTFLSMLLSSIPAVLVVGFVLIYPLECWVIRDRAARSWKWVAVRILLYMIASIPMGFVFLWGMRLGVRWYSSLLESSYFVTAVANVILFGFVYSFTERMLDQVQRREARLKDKIQQLRIEIDETKRRRQVREITETDYFQDLRLKARQLRAVRTG